ncbi:unnamed protein product, partial [marine sediment metagenome]
MEKEIGDIEGNGSKNGFIMINNNFLDYWSGIIGP